MILLKNIVGFLLKTFLLISLSSLLFGQKAYADFLVDDEISSAYPDIASDVGFNQTMAEIAKEELFVPDSCEYPVGSDNVKYNRWFYGKIVGNELDSDNNYIEQYQWNSVFVCWCAYKIGLVEYSAFPLEADCSMLYARLLEQEETICIDKDEIPEKAVKESDLIFVPDNDNYVVGIVTSVTKSTVDYIQGDLEYSVGKRHAVLSELPEGTKFVRPLSFESADLCSLVKYLCDQLRIPPAAACGVIASIYTESSFNPKLIGDGGTSYGICQWRNKRWIDMSNWCNENGYNWRREKGQMAYLIYDIKNNYVDMLKQMQCCDNTADGAYQTAFYFSCEYELPYATFAASDARGELAAKTLFPALLLCEQQ